MSDDVPPHATVHVRPSEARDVPSITRIYAHAVLHGRGTFELVPPDEDEMRRRRAALVDAGHAYLVAESEGRVVGYAYAGAYRPRAAYASTVESSVYVDPDRRGHGIGRLLVSRLIALAEAAGYRQMVAVVGDSDNHASIALHEGLGFSRIGVLRAVGWKHERWVDTVLMQRSLGAGAGAPPDAGG
ncbi:GNAT family N-acetyltransferase [Salinarimonas sp. NSM]|uniref:GNAT family N-acetyltransferase n=1 Tax=Salinarimonas sp. NSM TaxID=3458003 RepID=UPI0040371943